jgi:alkylation response protein AidB-like acyl-CoA dehydrogenase
MRFDDDPAERELRDRLRRYFDALLPELDGAADDPERHRRIRRRLGADGWLGLSWPTEFGGRGGTVREQFVFLAEAYRAEVPIPLIALYTVGPTIMRAGDRDQQARYLPAILAGDIDFAIGYTEPSAGTDLAALTTTAVREGAQYIVNGGKVFTSGGMVADYLWLAARTGPRDSRTRGLSILVVDLAADGVQRVPMAIVAPTPRGIAATYFTDVRVPVADRIGPENSGWQLITGQLNLERVAMAASACTAQYLLADVSAWLADGMARTDRHALARLEARTEALRLVNAYVVDRIAADALEPADASAAKVIGTEVARDVVAGLAELLAFAGPDAAALRARVESAALHAVFGTFAGGNNDVQRDVVARLGLGLPKPPTLHPEREGVPA